MMSAPLHPPPPEEQQRRRRNPRREVQPTTTTIPSKDSEETIALRILKSDGAAIFNRILKTGLNWKHIGNDSFQKEEYILCHKDCKKDTYEEGETGFKGFEGIAKCHNINPLQFHYKFPLPPSEKEKGSKCPVCADFQYDIILDSLSNYPDKTTKEDWDALLPKIAEIEAKHKKEEAEKKKKKEEEREKKKEELRKKRKKKEQSSKKRLKQATTNNDGGNDQTGSEVSIVVVDDDDDEEEVAVIGGSGNGEDGLLVVETNPRDDEEDSKPAAAASTSRPSSEIRASSSSPRSVVFNPFDDTANGTSSSSSLSRSGARASARATAASEEDAGETVPAVKVKKERPLVRQHDLLEISDKPIQGGNYGMLKILKQYLPPTEEGKEMWWKNGGNPVSFGYLWHIAQDPTISFVVGLHDGDKKDEEPSSRRVVCILGLQPTGGRRQRKTNDVITATAAAATLEPLKNDVFTVRMIWTHGEYRRKGYATDLFHAGIESLVTGGLIMVHNPSSHSKALCKNLDFTNIKDSYTKEIGELLEKLTDKMEHRKRRDVQRQKLVTLKISFEKDELSTSGEYRLLYDLTNEEDDNVKKKAARKRKSTSSSSNPSSPKKKKGRPKGSTTKMSPRSQQQQQQEDRPNIAAAGATLPAAIDTFNGSSSIIGSNNNNNAVTRNNESTTPSLAVGSSTEPQPLQQSHPQQRQQVDVAAIQLQLQQAKQEIQRLNDENKSLKDAASAAVQQQQQQQQNTDANEKSLKDEIESLRNENTALKDSAVKNEELIEASKKEKQTLNFKIDNLQKIIDAQIDLLKLKE